jgi:hypothetical protein
MKPTRIIIDMHEQEAVYMLSSMIEKRDGILKELRVLDERIDSLKTQLESERSRLGLVQNPVTVEQST